MIAFIIDTSNPAHGFLLCLVASVVLIFSAITWDGTSPLKDCEWPKILFCFMMAGVVISSIVFLCVLVSERLH